MQDCVIAITEHQRLQALVRGEWVKGLLPQSSVRADYTVQRIRGKQSYGNLFILVVTYRPSDSLQQDFIYLISILLHVFTLSEFSELAEGTCLKNYEYLGSGEIYDKKNKKWNSYV